MTPARMIRKRLSVALMPSALCAAVAALGLAAPASASVSVGYAAGTGGTVLSLDNADFASPMHVIIEQFVDSTRFGVRVRQIGLGDPTIFSNDPGCTTNPLFNDVVCTPFPASIQVHAFDAADHVIVGGSNVACMSYAGTHMVVSLNAGDDVLDLRNACGGQTSAPGINSLHPVYDSVDGGEGNDTLAGGRLNDHFFGDAGSDRLSGDSGNDVLDGGSGNDIINGGSGNDTLTGGEGADTLRGESGNDSLVGGPGADVLDGGAGFDAVSYAGLPGPVNVTLDGVANDGTSFGAEHDNVINVEHVIGSNGDDSITGSATAEFEVLDGGPGNDVLNSGGAQGDINGGDGNDLIDSRDSPATGNHVTCGFGHDEVIADLEDTVQPIESVRTATGVDSSAGCEVIDRFATDDGPPGRVVGKQVTIGARGSLGLKVACPRRAKVRCAGVLTVAEPRRGARAFARARYAVALGRSRIVKLRIPPAAAAKLRALGSLAASIREHGRSKKGPRTSSTLLQLVSS